MNPRDLPATRSTFSHPVPVRVYKLDFTSPQQSPPNLSSYGLTLADDETTSRTIAELGPLEPLGIYVDDARQVWVCVMPFLGFQPYLAPHPLERVRFEVGDSVADSRRWGEISGADPDALDPRSFLKPNFHELLRVRWNGEKDEMLHSTTDLTLHRSPVPK